jgi:hypothetical protein
VVQDAAKQGMIEILSGESKGQEFFFYKARQIKEEFSIPDTEAQEIAKSSIIKKISGIGQTSRDKFDDALKIIDEFSVPEAVVQDAAKQAMIHKIDYGNGIPHVLEIKEEFSVPEAVVQDAAKQGVIKILSDGRIDESLQIIDKFSIPEAEVEEVLSTHIKKSILEGKLNLILPYFDKFPDNVLNNLESEYHLLSYREDLDIESTEIYNQYRNLKQENDEIQLAGFIEKIKSIIGTMNETTELSEEVREATYYLSLVKKVYPESNYSQYKKNAEISDRNQDIEHLKFDSEGYEIKMSGIIGYERTEPVTPGALENYQHRVQQIQEISVNEQLFNEHILAMAQKAEIPEIIDNMLLYVMLYNIYL